MAPVLRSTLYNKADQILMMLYEELHEVHICVCANAADRIRGGGL